MKYYSEILDKKFDTEKELNKAEREYQDEKNKKELALKQQQNVISKEKKELSDNIEKAKENLEDAYAKLSIAREDADKIIRDAKAEAQKLLQPAREAVKVAENEKYKALAAFNQKYGSYTTIYTGNRALQEFNSAINWLDHFFDDFFF